MKRVEITWQDITASGGWMSRTAHEQASLLTCTSVGYLLNKDRHVVRICQSMTDQDRQAGESLTIPRSVIKRIKTLR